MRRSASPLPSACAAVLGAAIVLGACSPSPPDPTATPELARLYASRPGHPVHCDKGVSRFVKIDHKGRFPRYGLR